MTVCKWKHLGKGVKIYDDHLSVFLKPEQIFIGDYSRLDASIRIEGGLGVTIGERVHISMGSRLNIGGGELIFGAHSGCSDNVIIATGNPDISYLLISAAEAPEDCHVIKRRTIIGEYVVIFAGAIICPGVTIGDGVIIGAGSVVTKNVDPWSIVAGNPAHPIGRRELVVRN